MMTNDEICYFLHIPQNLAMTYYTRHWVIVISKYNGRCLTNRYINNIPILLILLMSMVETRGVEPLTSTLPALRSTSWATSPKFVKGRVSEIYFRILTSWLKVFLWLPVTWSWSDNAQKDGVPKGSRTPVAAVKGRSPRPLDDGD